MGMLPQLSPPKSKDSFDFPTPLSVKYQPQTVADFIGLDKPKAVMTAFLAKPYPEVWLFLGPPGTGKTTMGLAVAKAMKAEVIHIASSQCDLETVENTCGRCHYYPMGGGHWVVLVDEADKMTPAAQVAWLSKLDATDRPPNTVFIFTANSTRLLERRFLSRCLTVEFQTQRIGEALPKFLRTVWKKETGKTNTVNFDRIMESSEGNVRDALSRLEVEILAGGIPDEVVPEPSELPQDVSERGRPTDIPPCRKRSAGQGRVRFVDPKDRVKLGPGWQARGKTTTGKIVMIRCR